MKGDDRRMWIILEVSNNLHFIPSEHDISPRVSEHTELLTYRDLTRAAVVEVLDLWTSLTASFCPLAFARPSADEESLGRHSQTLPQFPKPIYGVTSRVSFRV